MMDINEFAQRVETNERIAGIINNLRDQLAEALSERDAAGEEATCYKKQVTRLKAELYHAQDVVIAARKYNKRPYGVENGDLRTMVDERIRQYDAAVFSLRVAPLINAIVEAAKSDERPFVEVYADVAQSERWARLWGGLSIAERNSVVAQAKREAGR